jgi:tRNA-2-methylthio-N6-dimethylallyladenosine synthase
MDVLFTGAGRYPGQAAGRTPYTQPVNVESATDLSGQVKKVKITISNSNSLIGRLEKEFVTA